MAYWPWHCAGLLGCAALLLLLSTLRVRKVALRQIAGSPAAKKPVRKPKKARMRRTCQPWLQLGMGNWPVLWKDLRTPVFGRSRVRRVVTMLLVLGGLGFFYILLAADHALDDDETHAVFCCLLTMLATFFTVIVPATSVTSEKESRSWPLLLGTTQSDWRILSSKWLALLRWCLPPWMLLFGHVLFFTLFGLIHPVALIQLGLVTAGIVNLLIGMGLYWSTRMRRTTTAVVRNFIVPLAIWVLIPLVSIMVAEFSHLSSRTVEGYLRWHPFFQAGAIGEACTGYQGQRLTYDWVTNRLNVWESTGVLFKTMCVHSMIGLGFAWRAKGLFRRNIF